MFSTVIYQQEKYIREIDLINWFQGLQIEAIKRGEKDKNDYIDGIKLLDVMTDHIKNLEQV